MVSLSVRLFTEDPAFESAWRSALIGVGLDAQQAAPATLADATTSDIALVIDASWLGFDEDELLAAAGYARALGAVPVVDGQGTLRGIISYVDILRRLADDADADARALELMEAI